MSFHYFAISEFLNETHQIQKQNLVDMNELNMFSHEECPATNVDTSAPRTRCRRAFLLKPPDGMYVC